MTKINYLTLFVPVGNYKNYNKKEEKTGIMLLKLSFLLMCWHLEFCELKQHFTREPDNQVDIFL